MSPTAVHRLNPTMRLHRIPGAPKPTHKIHAGRRWDRSVGSCFGGGDLAVIPFKQSELSGIFAPRGPVGVCTSPARKDRGDAVVWNRSKAPDIQIQGPRTLAWGRAEPRRFFPADCADSCAGDRSVMADAGQAGRDRPSRRARAARSKRNIGKSRSSCERRVARPVGRAMME